MPIEPISQNYLDDTNYLDRLNIVQPAKTSFSDILDEAVKAINELSDQDRQTSAITGEYIAGRASLEEVMFQTNKFSLQMQLAVTIVSTGVQTFKEIQNMQI